jgi:hypothetical protein
LPYRIPLIEDCRKLQQQKTFPYFLTQNPEWNKRGAAMAHRYKKNMRNVDTFVATAGIKAKMARKRAGKKQSAAGKTGSENKTEKGDRVRSALFYLVQR